MPINVIPKFLQKAFADTGAKTNIPLNADLVNGRAGYAEGFPPINMTAVAAGGIPPFGQDMNGVLYDLSAAIQYEQSGIEFPFDSAFATAIGGYGVGAVVSDPTDKSLLWINGTASNTAFPTGWTQFSLKKSNETIQGTIRVGTQEEVNAGTRDDVVVTPKKFVDAFKGSAGSLSPNGYQKLPSGLIIQWGQAVTASGQGGVGGIGAIVAFPITFPNSYLQSVITAVQTSSTIISAWSDNELTTGLRVTTNGIAGTVIRYIAIGR